MICCFWRLAHGLYAGFFGDLIGGQVMLLVVLFPIRLIVAELTCRCWFWLH